MIKMMNAFFYSLNKNGLDKSLLYSEREILSEILIGLDNATDEQGQPIVGKENFKLDLVSRTF